MEMCLLTSSEMRAIIGGNSNEDIFSTVYAEYSEEAQASYGDNGISWRWEERYNPDTGGKDVWVEIFNTDTNDWEYGGYDISFFYEGGEEPQGD